ncbi:MAG TPA: HlyD family efflux transporter periplasmic adaptor subunit [Candidatus Limnocylindria bacterium]|nr:HlyD family efflux transporter periplasmic adaptor subunit [Candidatus Limnocylindria bacterium]
MTGNANRKGKRAGKRIWLWVLPLLAAAGAFALFRMGVGARPAYRQVTAGVRDIVTWYAFSGNLTPVTDETQLSKQQMRVRETLVQEGDTVAEGQPLLRAVDGTRVLARSAGTVETLFAEADDLLQPGSPIARIVDYGRLEVSVDVDEYDINALSVGKKGDVYVNALDLTMPGTVSSIAREATTSGGVSYYPVKLQISAVTGNILSGMSVEVRVLRDEARGAVSLLAAAISFDEDNNPYALVRQGDREMERRPLSIGISDGVYVEVLSGLAANETVYYNDRSTTRFFPVRIR